MTLRLNAHRLRGGPFGGRRGVGRLVTVAAIAVAASVLVGALARPAAAAQAAVVAQAKGKAISVYRSPGARHPFLRLRNPSAGGGPLVFLVKRRATGWEQVYLPRRPNGSTGWVRDAAVDLALDSYRVVVSLAHHTITVWKGGRVIHFEPAGVGRSVMPTPTGIYFIAELFEQPDPRGLYGPFAFGLSAYSNVLYTFGGGPGQIGLHGTNDPAGLGTSVSHGCIRVSNAGIAELARILPLGTPVRITG